MRRHFLLKIPLLKTPFREAPPHGTSADPAAGRSADPAAGRRDGAPEPSGRVIFVRALRRTIPGRCFSAALLASLLLGACEPGPVRRGDALFEEKRYEEAARSYAQVIDEPNASDTLKRKYALSLALSGHAKEALPLLEALNRQRPDDDEIAASLIDATALVKGFETGWALAKTLEPHFPKSAHILRALGTVAGQRGDIETARRYLEQALSIDPNLAPALANLGDLRFFEKDYIGASDYYQRAIAAEPNSPMSIRVRVRMAQILAESDPSQAMPLLEEALKIDPHAADALAELGKILASVGLPDQALDYLKEAYDGGIERPDVISTIGWCYMRRAVYQSDPGEKRRTLLAARMWLKKLIDKAPTWKGAHNNLGKVLRQLGDLSEAESAFRQELTLYPSSIEATSNLGRLLRELGRYDEAKALLTRAFEVDRRQVSLAMELGRMAMIDQDWPEGLEWYKKALDLCQTAPVEHPCRWEVPYQLARLSVHGNDRESAVAWLVKAIDYGFSDVARLKAEPELRGLLSDRRVSEALSAIERR